MLETHIDLKHVGKLCAHQQNLTDNQFTTQTGPAHLINATFYSTKANIPPDVQHRWS